MTNNRDPEVRREKFHELGRQRQAVLDELAPIEVQLQTLVAAHSAAEQPLRDQIKVLKAPLFDIDMDRSELVKLLDGKTGTPEQYSTGKRAETE